MVYVLVMKMKELEKKIRYSKLFAIYNPLLSSTQKEMMEDYFNLDLSLSEIASNRNVSRSAVDDAIKKAINKLDEFEDNMHLLEKNENIKKELESLKEKALNLQEIEEIEKIEKELDYGI